MAFFHRREYKVKALKIYNSPIPTFISGLQCVSGVPRAALSFIPQVSPPSPPTPTITPQGSIHPCVLYFQNWFSQEKLSSQQLQRGLLISVTEHPHTAWKSPPTQPISTLERDLKFRKRSSRLDSNQYIFLWECKPVDWACFLYCHLYRSIYWWPGDRPSWYMCSGMDDTRWPG